MVSLDVWRCDQNKPAWTIVEKLTKMNPEQNPLLRHVWKTNAARKTMSNRIDERVAGIRVVGIDEIPNDHEREWESIGKPIERLGSLCGVVVDGAVQIERQQAQVQPANEIKN